MSGTQGWRSKFIPTAVDKVARLRADDRPTRTAGENRDRRSIDLNNVKASDRGRGRDYCCGHRDIRRDRSGGCGARNARGRGPVG